MEVTEFKQPFRFLVADDFAPLKLAGACAYAIPSAVDRGWVRYDNDCEKRKWTCNDFQSLGNPWEELFYWMNEREQKEWLGRSVALPGSALIQDTHGAGCHVSFGGSYLAPHLDFALNPKNKLERVVNIVLYLNRTWKHEWGGGTVMCDLLGNSKEVVMPQFNRAVIWRSGDDTVHGTELTTYNADPRITAACYYSREPDPDRMPTRQRAMFLPRRY